MEGVCPGSARSAGASAAVPASRRCLGAGRPGRAGTRAGGEAGEARRPPLRLPAASGGGGRGSAPRRPGRGLR